ncbi:MAG: hypothetical protein KGH49_01015, partial [Candidatus Micrarchaeota archaeon]|nr:hypothetical protein [Candidatus Micrarchaeota archaeon]
NKPTQQQKFELIKLTIRRNDEAVIGQALQKIKEASMDGRLSADTIEKISNLKSKIELPKLKSS